MKITSSLHGSLRCLLAPTLFALGMTGTLSAHANTLRVPANYPTIQAAVNAAISGDTVLVAYGTYTGAGNKNIDFGGKNLTVKSPGSAASCIIDCQNSGRGFYIHNGESSASRIEGLTIKNGRATGSSPTTGGGVFAFNSQLTVMNCIFIGNSADKGGGMYFGNAFNCRFSSNRGNAIAEGTATNCVFTQNDHGPTMASCRAIHCTFVGNDGEQAGLLSGSIAISCILWNNSGNIDTSMFRSRIGYSNVQGGYTGSGNINTDPHFVNAAAGDYHLRTDSPCINAGTSTVPPYAGLPLPATDADGNPRVLGPAPDMGAYEVLGYHIHGNLLFQGVVASATPQTVTFQLRPVSGGTPVTQTYQVPANGEFTVDLSPPGNYILWVKGEGYLANAVVIDPSHGDVTGVILTSRAGDGNNDNVVDIADLVLLINHYNQTLSSPGYLAAADYNRDGVNDIADLLLVINNYNTQGVF